MNVLYRNFLNHMQRAVKLVWRGHSARALLILSSVLLIAAAITFFTIYYEGNRAAENSQDLLMAYEQTITDLPTQTESDNSSVPVQTSESYAGYQVIGKLIIEKIGLQLPVISEVSTDALKVSCCYYKGAMPGEPGNMIITGHNYASGAIFGGLHELEVGNIVAMSTLEKDYTYEVYELKTIEPDDVAALDDYKSGTVLTLLTCTSYGNKRLLVRCKKIS